MFRQVAKNENEALALLRRHPLELAALMEATWAGRLNTSSRATEVTGLPEYYLRYIIGSAFPSLYKEVEPYPGGEKEWTLVHSCDVVLDHLIYSYLVENTRIYEIFGRVLRDYLHGERLEIPLPDTQQWLRTTEELFYRDTPSFFAFQLTSYIRPDIRASRRNAYYRMFGMDLAHGTDDGRRYSYERPAAANQAFVSTFEEFLREVWRGIVNAKNQSGPNATDEATILRLVKRLSDMLKDRRQHGNLLREEFFFVATMSWLHLALEFNASPVVRDLKVTAANSAERLRKIGERVGLPAYNMSDEMFSLADPMSRILIAIESGSFTNIEQVKLFYKDPPTQLRSDITTIITNWSVATGRNIKAEPVTPSPSAGVAATASRAISPAAMSPNGGAPATVPRT